MPVMTAITAIQLAQKAISMIGEARETLETVKDAVADGKVAMNETDRAKLEDLLEREEEESKAAHDALAAAIAAARD